LSGRGDAGGPRTRVVRAQASADAASSEFARRCVEYCLDVYTSAGCIHSRAGIRCRGRVRAVSDVCKGFIRRKKLIDTVIAWG